MLLAKTTLKVLALALVIFYLYAIFIMKLFASNDDE